MTIMPHLFLVKISKAEQKAAKEKISKDSPFFLPVGSIHNSKNMECGEIIQIGEQMRGTDKYDEYLGEELRSGIYGWKDCEVGHTLIFHHTIESKEGMFLYDDETHNYYAVDYVNVRGYYDGTKIVPGPNYVFLKNTPAFPAEGERDSATGNNVKKTEGGIYIVTNWDESPQYIGQRSQKIKEQIESLTKSKRTDEIQRRLEELELERQQLNRKAQRHLFLPYLVAFSNKRVDRDFGIGLREDDILYCYNKAALYISNFQLVPEYKYIICPVEHIGGLQMKPKS